MTKRPIFVLTAQISAHLHFATKVAKRISLTAKNARAVTVRAGAQAAGFRAITDFIEELAATTIRSAEQINVIAVNISRMASDHARNQQALENFNKILEKSSDAPYIDSILPARQRAQDSVDFYRDNFHREINKLTTNLEESAKQVRSANIIASTSKIEAAQLQTFQKEFRTIAEDIELASQQIRKHLDDAEKLLMETLSESSVSA